MLCGVLKIMSPGNSLLGFALLWFTYMLLLCLLIVILECYGKRKKRAADASESIQDSLDSRAEPNTQSNNTSANHVQISERNTNVDMVYGSDNRLGENGLEPKYDYNNNTNSCQVDLESGLEANLIK